jgi:hypothetical protein
MMFDRRLIPRIGAALALLLCIAALFVDRRAFFASALAAWWFWMGMALGAQGNLWIQRLTGGRWIAPIAAPLQRLRANIPLLAVLMLVPLAGMRFLYPWAQDWVDSAKETAFRSVWLTPGAMTARDIACVIALTLYSAWGLRGGRSRSSRTGYAALGLLLYTYAISVLAYDLLASLSPRWYSSAFGLAVLLAQLKAGMAYAVFAGARRAEPDIRNDLGNFLLTYVMSWAYVAFTQFQIIWAENLPAEISWYVPRMQTAWAWLGIALVAVGFGVPMVLLLMRRFKRSASCLRAMAGLLLVLSWLEVVWWIFPSLQATSLHVLWMLPAATLAMGWLALAGGRVLLPRSLPGPAAQQGDGHA